MTAPSPATAAIPVTIVGGFLGAGKTTFLNHLLKTSGARYAVLVNDFGAVNIDASLIARHDGTTMTLANGCVCCSIGDGFLDTLGNVLDARIPFDHIIIEASGVGDPWRIAEIALIEPSLPNSTPSSCLLMRLALQPCWRTRASATLSAISSSTPISCC